MAFDFETRAKLSQEIGACVLVNQLFESVFAFACRGIIPDQELETMVKPLSDEILRQPSSVVLGRLKEKLEFNSEFEQRLTAYVQNRHAVIHRGLREFGADEAGLKEYQDMATATGCEGAFLLMWLLENRASLAFCDPTTFDAQLAGDLAKLREMSLIITSQVDH